MKKNKIVLAATLLIISTSCFYLVQCSRGETKTADPAATVTTQQKTSEQTQEPQSPALQQQNTEKATTTTDPQSAAEKPQAKAAGGIKVTFIELGSVNCIPCKMMQPVMKAIEEEYGDQVKVVFHDVWTPEGRPYAQQYAIQAIPTQVFLDATGKEYYRHTGFFPKEELVKVLQMKDVE